MGVHFCTGNHEYYAGWKPWCDHLSANGWRVHLNAHEVHRRGAASLMVAGIPDRFAPRHEPSHRCDLETTCGSAPQTDLRVLLAHQPRSLNELPKGHFDLVLSGHTHGGQFFPFTLLIICFSRSSPVCIGAKTCGSTSTAARRIGVRRCGSAPAKR